MFYMYIKIIRTWIGLQGYVSDCLLAMSSCQATSGDSNLEVVFYRWNKPGMTYASVSFGAAGAGQNQASCL